HRTHSGPASPPPPLPCAPDDPVPPDRRDTAPPSLSAAARLSATVPRPCLPLLPLSLQSWSRSCTHLYRASRGTPTKKSQALSEAPRKLILIRNPERVVEGSRGSNSPSMQHQGILPSPSTPTY